MADAQTTVALHRRPSAVDNDSDIQYVAVFQRIHREQAVLLRLSRPHWSFVGLQLFY